ncbi:conserved exported protein of unknown function [Georgfuchsia toluolica]|uniref:DUF4398 domain-containing protein n=1 Tax=Georgfuchsia toluolica TaxID=424218 RepID=A0A916J6Z6_9PROT|nr:hypothetical protein [Georgfuchsia toluolica]CAG4884340.1 conserved exported protein of unknown function [Georgfuchsia toluolica]
MKTFTIIIALVMLLTGCAQLSQLRTQIADNGYYWIKPGQAHASGRAAALLYYADYVRNLNATDYAQEAEHVRLLYTSEKTDFRLLQYALALSVPGGDARKAQQMIEPLLKKNKSADTELDALAQLLDSDLAERRRLEAETRQAEAEAKRAEAEAKRAEASARRAEAGAKRAEELEKQLEAIKNIEKNMIEHGKSGGEKQ